jgi:RNA-directed DNA polymerase
MLKAGYLEDWVYHETLSGSPQGGLCSAEHKEPYAQRRVMRSAGLPGLVVAGSAGERCA